MAPRRLPVKLTAKQSIQRNFAPCGTYRAFLAQDLDGLIPSTLFQGKIIQMNLDDFVAQFLAKRLQFCLVQVNMTDVEMTEL